MSKNTIIKHTKKKSHKLNILLWAIIFLFAAVIIMFLFALSGKELFEIVANKNYWLCVGVTEGLTMNELQDYWNMGSILDNSLLIKTGGLKMISGDAEHIMCYNEYGKCIMYSEPSFVEKQDVFPANYLSQNVSNEYVKMEKLVEDLRQILIEYCDLRITKSTDVFSALYALGICPLLIVKTM